MLTAEEQKVERRLGNIESRDGSLWLNASGESSIPGRRGPPALENPDYRLHYRVFEFLDGLPGHSRTTVSDCRRRHPTDVWFSTTKGIAWIDPKQV